MERGREGKIILWPYGYNAIQTLSHFISASDCDYYNGGIQFCSGLISKRIDSYRVKQVANIPNWSCWCLGSCRGRG